MHTYRIPVSKAEYEQIKKIAEHRRLKQAALIRILLLDAVEEYKRKCSFGIYISLKYEEFQRFTYVQTYVPSEIRDFFISMAKSTGGLKEGQLVRHFLIPKLTQERTGE